MGCSFRHFLLRSSATEEADLTIKKETARTREKKKNTGAVGLIFRLFILVMIVSIVLGYAI